MTKYILILMAISSSLIGCDKRSDDNGFTEHQYRVKVKTIEDHESLLIQKITIEGKGQHQVVLNSKGRYIDRDLKLSPNSTEKVATHELTMIATLTRMPHKVPGSEQRQLIVTLVRNHSSQRVNGASAETSFWAATPMIVNDITLKDVYILKNSSGIYGGKTSLFEAKNENDYIELYVDEYYEHKGN